MKSKLIIGFLFFILVGNVFSQTVYVTKTGTKYHTEGCKYLKKSKYSMELSEAKSSGYGPCSICKPSGVVRSPQSSNQKTETSSPGAQSQSKSVSVQCSATTKSGTRCKRMTTSSNGKCYQHGG